MIGQLIIAFREGFEAILLVSILITYLRKTGRENFIKDVYYGVVLAITVGAVISLLMIKFYRGFENKELFEGISALIAAAVLTSMIYWMGIKGLSLKNEIKRKVDSGKTSFAILIIAFFFAIREVVETILFLMPFATIDFLTTATGTVAGLILAVLFSLFISSSIMKVDLRNFFYYSSLILILIAGGLIGYGVHELLEYSKEMGFENFLHATAFDFGVDENSLIHHKNIIGSFFAVMFGYTVKAEVGRVIAHLLYLSLTFPIVFRVYASKKLYIRRAEEVLGGVYR